MNPLHIMPARHWRGRARAALRSRSGATAAAIAVSGSVLLGMAGLAAEGTLLYLTRRDAQNGADLAAMAAASAYQFRGRGAALAAATEIGIRNGFTSPAITVRNPPETGAMAGNSNAFEVRITGQVPITLGRAFTDRDHGTVAARAVALLHGTTPACLLALTGGVTIQNSSSFEAVGCAVGSNTPGVSVTIPQSNSSVRARAVVAFGTCSGCNNTRWTLAEGFQEHAAPLSNPYEQLDRKPVPPGCMPPPTMDAAGAIPVTGVTRAYCADVEVGNRSSITFRPGTYVFKDAALRVGSTASFACNGCTFIFTGTSPRNFNLSNMASITISAPSMNADDSDYDGIVIHRGRGAVGNAGNPNLIMQSSASFNIKGGIYAPDSYVRVGSISSNTTTSCLALVGGTLEIGSLSSFRFNTSGCADLRTPVPMARVARLVE
ncbi:hypothetical protein [Roseomonas sp. WA12]